MLVVDTNILVYAADRDAQWHAPCNAWIEQQRRQAAPWYLTWGIAYEFLRVATHPRVFRKPWPITDAWRFIETILAAPSANVLLPTQRHAQVLRQTLEELPHLCGNVVHDAHTAVLMREHGIRQIVTRDTDFHKFPFLAVVDPLAD